MNVTRNFAPVVITLETKEDLNDLVTWLNKALECNSIKGCCPAGAYETVEDQKLVAFVKRISS